MGRSYRIGVIPETTRLARNVRRRGAVLVYQERVCAFSDLGLASERRTPAAVTVEHDHRLVNPNDASAAGGQRLYHDRSGQGNSAASSAIVLPPPDEGNEGGWVPT
jgi:hypothetical protein